MKLIISIAILLFIVPSAHSESLTSYVNKNGQTVWTNNGRGSSGESHGAKDQAAKTTNAIHKKHPGMSSNHATSLSYQTWVTHFMAHGEPRRSAMRLAETQMVQGGRIPILLPEQPVYIGRPVKEKRPVTTQKKKKKSPGKYIEPVTALRDIRKFKREMRAITDFNRRATGMIDIESAAAVGDLQRHHKKGKRSRRGGHAAHPKSRRSNKTNCAGGGSALDTYDVGIIDKRSLRQNIRPGRNGNKHDNNTNQQGRGHHSSPNILLPDYNPPLINRGY